MKIYAMSDIHGCLREFDEALSCINFSDNDTKLVILGDYIHYGIDSYGVLDRIMDLQEQYGREKIIALMGNHEQMVIQRDYPIDNNRFGCFSIPHKRNDSDYIWWIKKLPLYYETQNQIFCHAGIDETLGEKWRDSGTKYFLWYSSHKKGSFYMDVIAGHISTSDIAGISDFHEIYFDGQSHYYIDGCTQKSGTIPVLLFDTDENKYYRAYKSKTLPVQPFKLTDNSI